MYDISTPIYRELLRQHHQARCDYESKKLNNMVNGNFVKKFDPKEQMKMELREELIKELKEDMIVLVEATVNRRLKERS